MTSQQHRNPTICFRHTLGRFLEISCLTYLVVSPQSPQNAIRYHTRCRGGHRKCLRVQLRRDEHLGHRGSEESSRCHPHTQRTKWRIGKFWIRIWGILSSDMDYNCERLNHHVFEQDKRTMYRRCSCRYQSTSSPSLLPYARELTTAGCLSRLWDVGPESGPDRWL